MLSLVKQMMAPLQAHQIQGLDYPALFPVVQWLVKRVLATREEFGDRLRAFALPIARPRLAGADSPEQEALHRCGLEQPPDVP